MSDTLQHILALLPQLTSDEKLHLIDEISQELLGEAVIVEVRRQGETIIIPLTRNELTYRYLGVEKHKDFFPADTVGEADPNDGTGKLITLHLEGVPGTFEADVYRPRYRLRLSGEVLEKFFRVNKLKAGDSVVVERQSEYEYWLYPLR